MKNKNIKLRRIDAVFLYGIKLFVHKWTVVVVQSFGICVVVHGVFVAKTFVFYLLFLAVEVLIMSCLHRQNSAQCKFRRWAIFSHGVYCKNYKNFCLLLAVFSIRSFDYVVFTQEKLCAMQVSQVGNFFARRFGAKTAKTFLLYSPFFVV